MSKKYIISIIVIIVVILIGVFVSKKDGGSDYQTVTVERNNLIQEVGVTGKVEPSSKVNLAFESTGKVANVYVKIGDRVFAGQRLADINNSQYQAQYAQAKALLDTEKIKLEELLKGTREEEIAIQEVRVNNAEQSVKDANNALENKIKDAFTKSDDAIRNKVDQLFINPRGTTPQLIFNTDSSLKNSIESERVSLEDILIQWGGLVLNDDFISPSETKQNLNTITSFLDKVSFAVNGMTITSTISQTTIDGYKTAISTARTSINTAISNLTTAEEKYRTAESNLLLVKQELVLKLAGATEEQIRTQESRVLSAEANMNNFGALIGKTIIYSPINGVVTKSNIEKGEIAQMNVSAISIIGAQEFEIEAFIPEADIAKIQVGNDAQIVLDAYDDIYFKAKIVTVDPAETLIEGVSTYKIILQFIEKDERIRSGMTANIDISTDSREDVLSIPYRTIQTNGSKFVKVLEGGEVVKKEVEIGMRSTDGQIEIISGLSEGEEVILR